MHRRLVMYTSEHAHSSVEKAGITLGIGQDNIRKIPVDDAFRMRVDVLRETVTRDQRAGKRPFCIVPTVGTTSTSSIDPVDADRRRRRRVRRMAARGRGLRRCGGGGARVAIDPGRRRARHSLVVNPHKWLFTPVDLSAFYTRKPEILRRAFSLVPEYLRTAEDPRAVNYMDYGVQLGRRFRALKLWFIMRHYGREGIAELIRKHIDYAQRLAGLIREHPDFEIAAPTPFSLICFRYRGSDDENRALLDAVNASGKAFLSHTVLNGRFVLRLAIGNIATQWEDLEETWNLVRQRPRIPSS